MTAVDGQSVAKGEELRGRPGTMVGVGGVLTIAFLGDPMLRMSESTILPR